MRVELDQNAHLGEIENEKEEGGEFGIEEYGHEYGEPGSGGDESEECEEESDKEEEVLI